MAQPTVPGIQPLPGARRNRQDDDVRIDLPGVARCMLCVELDMREEVDFVEHHQSSGAEHVRIFQRFVFPFGHRKDDNLRPLTGAMAGGTTRPWWDTNRPCLIKKTTR